MTQNERVKEIRKALGLTLEKFGERLGLKKNAISQIETGKNSLTEQNIRAICREFGIDYIYLTTGEGNIFVESDDDFMDRIDRIMAGENDDKKAMIKALLYASDEDIAVVNNMINMYLSFRNEVDDEESN